MKKWMITAAAISLILGGVYFGSPYYAVHSLRNAALEADTDKLETSVDFPSVRESLKSQLSASLMSHMQSDPKMKDNPFAGLGTLMVPAIVDRAIETFVTPDGIAALIRGQKPNETAKIKENPDIEARSGYISADRFRVRLRNKARNEDGPSLIFERRGFASWKLIKVQLPPNLLEPAGGGSVRAVSRDSSGAEEETAPPASSPCGVGSLAIDLGINARGGAVEVMTPLADTDGKKPYRVTAQPVICVSPGTIAAWKRQAGAIENGQTWEVTYDPSGSPGRMRSQFDYSVLMCEELASTPSPPSDLMLGNFKWSPSMATNSVRVRWEPDFRAYQERSCV